MKIAVTALVVWVVTAPLLLVGTAGHAIHNGDEAIYAEMAREMRATGDFGTLRWQGEPQFPRPPSTVWLLAVTGTSHLRELEAAACALEVALVLVLGWLWWGPAAGAAAAGLLLGSDLFLGYARYLESEPFLCVAILASLIAWERRRFVWWGVFLGLALMTKQLVGALPLLPLVLERRREAWQGLLAAAAVWLPWHVWSIAVHGREFLQSYFVENLLARSTAAMLRPTRWTFYLRELWRSEGIFTIVFAAGLGGAAWRRAAADRLVLVWALGVLVVYSIARSRYDYYLLLAYPAFALAVGALVARAGRLAWLVGPALTVSALALHAPRNLGHFEGEDEQQYLVGIVNRMLTNTKRLYTYNTHSYAGRFYSRVDVTTLLESADDLRAAEALKKSGMPSSVLLAADLPATLASLPRPFALIMPRARASLLPKELELLGESPHFLLLEGK